MTAPLKRGKLSKVEEFYIENNYRTKEVDEIASDLNRSVNIVAKAIEKLDSTIDTPEDQSDSDVSINDLQKEVQQLREENDALKIGNKEKTGTGLDHYARNGNGVVTATQVATTRADESRKKQKLMPRLKNAVQKMR